MVKLISNYSKKEGMMILVFILFTIIILAIILFCLVMLSTLKIQVQNLSLANIPIKQKAHYHITISLYLGKHIKWLWISLNQDKVQKLYNKIKLSQINLKSIEKTIQAEEFKILKEIQPKISSLKLKASIGVESPIITSFLVAILSSAISIALPHVAKKIESKNYQYEITPIYENKNLYKINLNCIIELKMVHIINIIYILKKKGKSEKNERTTSNRKSYGYSYE